MPEQTNSCRAPKLTNTSESARLQEIVLFDPLPASGFAIFQPFSLFFAQQTGSSYGFIFENSDAALLFKGLPPTENSDGEPDTNSSRKSCSSNVCPHERPWLCDAPLPVTPVRKHGIFAPTVPCDHLPYRLLRMPRGGLLRGCPPNLSFRDSPEQP